MHSPKKGVSPAWGSGTYRCYLVLRSYFSSWRQCGNLLLSLIITFSLSITKSSAIQKKWKQGTLKLSFIVFICFWQQTASFQLMAPTIPWVNPEKDAANSHTGGSTDSLEVIYHFPTLTPTPSLLFPLVLKMKEQYIFFCQATEVTIWTRNCA